VRWFVDQKLVYSCGLFTCSSRSRVLFFRSLLSPNWASQVLFWCVYVCVRRRGQGRIIFHCFGTSNQNNLGKLLRVPRAQLLTERSTDWKPYAVRPGSNPYSISFGLNTRPKKNTSYSLRIRNVLFIWNFVRRVNGDIYGAVYASYTTPYDSFV